MTRRLTIAISIAVLVSVALAGVGTVVLARAEDRRNTGDDLRNQATALASLFETVPLAGRDPDLDQRRLEVVRDQLRIADAVIVGLGANGIVGRLPVGLDRDAIDVDALRREGAASGADGATIYGAAVGERRRATFVLVLTSDQRRLVSPITRWVVLSGALAVLAGALVAWWLSRRIGRPLRDAAATARRIAAGDLAARVDLDDAGDDELGDLGRAVNEMAESLERSRRSERQFLMSVSHDLRTPLTSIRGYAEAIADGAVDDPVRAAGVIGSEGRRLERLVTDLLDLARLETRQFRLDPTTLDLSEIMPDVCAGFEHEAHGLGVTITTMGIDEPLPVRGDADRVAQVLANLVQNALGFADRAVVVRCRPQTSQGGTVSRATVEIAVDDDGPGIDPEDLPHVFERLYSSDRTRGRRGAGSGLGLAIARELIAAMDGSVRAEHSPTGGARLVVTLPAAGADSDPADRATEI